MSFDESTDKPIWERFALLGLRFTRSLAEIAELQTKRAVNTVMLRADDLYARRGGYEPGRRAIHTVSAWFDDVMDRLRKEEED